MKSIKGKKVGVLGLGDENIALVKYLVKHEANVFVLDQKKKEELGDYLSQISNLPIQYRLGPDYLDYLEDFEVIFRTPGLPYFNPKIQAAKKAGIEVSSEIKLFFSLCPCQIFGVTGTKGKGTTASLISEILTRNFEALNSKHETNHKIQNSENKNISDFGFRISDLKPKVFLGGNIGNPPIEFLEKLHPNNIVILELSSFQLQDLNVSPHIAVVLDIKIDHLDYHKDEDEYCEAKSNIVKYQNKKDFAVINADYQKSSNFKNLTKAQILWFSRKNRVDKGVWVKNDREIILRLDDQDQIIIDVKDLQLRGKHNYENISAAILASKLAGADIAVIREVIKSFKGLEHRLEFVRDYSGIKYYNDSYSTTPDTAIAAINSFHEPILLLLGGSEKNADYQELAKVISKSSVKMIISIGKTSERIIKLVDNRNTKIISDIKTMDEAVKIAKENSVSGDIVLLSPASASFDRYKNYKDRGNQFKKLILNFK